MAFNKTFRALARTRVRSATQSLRMLPPMTFASTRLRVPTDYESLTGSDKAAIFRQSAGSPAYTIAAGNPFRVCFAGFKCNGLGNSPTEEIAGSGPWQVAYSLEFNGVRYPALFSGATWSREMGGDGATRGYATAFDWGLWSDEFVLPVDLPANSTIFHCSAVKVASTATPFPTYPSASALIGDVWRSETSPSAIEALLTEGTITGNSPGVGHGVFPMFMVAKGGDGRPSVLVIGDSRAEGNGDFRSGQPDPRGIKQSVERGLDSLTGGRLPSGFIAISGSGMGGSAVSPGLDHRAAPLQWIKDTYGSFPFEYIVDQHGNNGSQGWETMKAHAAIVRTKFPGVRYIKVTIPPNIGQNTTDAYRTLDGVTPIAAATYPSGARALLNGYILANRESTWDAVFDAGKYGMANDGVSDGQVGHTDDFMKSRFPTALRSGVLTQDWDGTSSAGMFLNFAALPGDLLNWDISNRQNSCLISTVTQISETVWQAFPENSLGLGTPVAAGATIVLIPSGDGTHEMTWVSILEQRAYEIMKAQGYFGSTPS